MAIVHIVLFQFKSTADANTVSKICSAMLDLKEKCISPESQQPYILNSTGGRNNSPEGKSEGLSHAFVTIFASEEDRTYYLESDPAHLQFMQEAKEGMERAVVVDYEPSAM